MSVFHPAAACLPAPQAATTEVHRDVCEPCGALLDRPDQPDPFVAGPSASCYAAPVFSPGKLP
jgi:hypothetical protein